MILFNPTNDVLKKYYIGLEVILKPGEKLKVSDACGRHVLNSMARRGMMSLEYGDNEKEVARIGIKRNIEFKRKQVLDWNLQNEARKQTNRPYLNPTEEVRRYAEELGLELMEPYALTQDRESAKSSEIEEKLQEQINELRELVVDLSKMVSASVSAKETAKKPPKKG